MPPKRRARVAVAQRDLVDAFQFGKTRINLPPDGSHIRKVAVQITTRSRKDKGKVNRLKGAMNPLPFPGRQAD